MTRRSRAPYGAPALPACAVLAAFLALVGPLAGCGKKAAGHLVVEPDRVDFGQIFHGATVERRLRLVNEGPRRVLVRAAQANCTCFSVHVFKQALEPGEATEVRVTMDSGMVPPEQARGKHLDIQSDDPKTPRLRVPLDADVIRLYTITPEVLDLGQVGEDARERGRRIEIRPGAGRTVTLEDLSVVPAGLLEVTPEPQEHGIDLHVRVAGEATGTGRLSAQIRLGLRLRSSQGEDMRLEAGARVLGAWPR